jgi:hypothetical protein
MTQIGKAMHINSFVQFYAVDDKHNNVISAAYPKNITSKSEEYVNYKEGFPVSINLTALSTENKTVEFTTPIAELYTEREKDRYYMIAERGGKSAKDKPAPFTGKLYLSYDDFLDDEVLVLTIDPKLLEGNPHI